MRWITRLNLRSQSLVLLLAAFQLVPWGMSGSAQAVPTSAPPPNIPGVAATAFLYGVVDEETGVTNQEVRSISKCTLKVAISKWIEDPLGGGHYPVRSSAACAPYQVAAMQIDFIMVYDDEDYSVDSLIFATQPEPPRECANCHELSWLVFVPCGHNLAEIECGHELYAVSRTYLTPGEVKVETPLTPTQRLRAYDFRAEGAGSSCDVATPHPNLKEICYLFGEGGN